jgi:hypothetical protein
LLPPSSLFLFLIPTPFSPPLPSIFFVPSRKGRTGSLGRSFAPHRRR